MDSLPKLSTVEDAVFASIRSTVEAGKSGLSDEDLLRLHVLFGRNLQRAVQIVDAGAVRCVVARTSRRRVYQVPGRSSGEVYLVFPDHYCSCHAFYFDVVAKGDATNCKHQLAARIVQALGSCAEQEVSDEQLAELLLQGTQA